MIENRTIENAIGDILVSIGENPNRTGLRDTPRRVAEMYRELFSGVDRDPAEELSAGFEEGHRDLVLLKDINFYSMCEHHLVPFFGTANIGYLPTGRVVGVSRIVRALDVLSHRPQMQERLTTQLADVLFSSLDAEGVAVVLKAEHLCMSMRGVRKPGTQVVTSVVRGTFPQFSASHKEILAELGGM